MSPQVKLSIEQVNSLDYGEFINRFRNVVPHGTVITAGVWSKKPFQDLEHLYQVFSQLMDQLPLQVKEGCLRCVADLTGRNDKMMGTLSAESLKEQTGADLLNTSNEEQQNLDKWNKEYKAKFGYPFVICCRLNKRDAILAALERRLQNSSKDEVVNGLEEVKNICHLRLADIVEGGDHLGANF